MKITTSEARQIEEISDALKDTLYDQGAEIEHIEIVGDTITIKTRRISDENYGWKDAGFVYEARTARDMAEFLANELSTHDKSYSSEEWMRVARKEVDKSGKNDGNEG